MVGYFETTTSLGDIEVIYEIVECDGDRN